ncbi:MAG: hypothetical protein AMS21_08310 [Gemmatimonas sp. SG8_38_2]|nr:MAG: hypothetical protein AMS21_08310 [Gemmatimonas sp. SG8_38_2]
MCGRSDFAARCRRRFRARTRRRPPGFAGLPSEAASRRLRRRRSRRLPHPRAPRRHPHDRGPRRRAGECVPVHPFERQGRVRRRATPARRPHLLQLRRRMPTGPGASPVM